MPLTEVLTELLGEVFMLSPDEIDSGTPRSEIDAWDSLAVTSLALGIKQRCGVQLDLETIAGIERLGDLQTLIERAKAQQD